MIMMNNHKAIKKQKGAAVLLISIILLIGVTLITIFAARVGVMDQRISANEYRHIQAKASSGAALDEASGFLDSNKDLYDGAAGWSDCDASPALQQAFPCTLGGKQYEKVFSTVDSGAPSISKLAYTTTLSNGADSKSFLVFTTSAGVGNILTAVGTGESIDGTGKAAEQVSYSKGTILVPGQVPPVMTPNIMLNGGFTIVGNPNLDGASGVNATVWATTVGSSGTWQTCNAGNYKDGTTVCLDEYTPEDDWSGCDCDTTEDGYGNAKYLLSYRSAGNEKFGDDILNPSVFPFPTDVFDFVFGMSKSQMFGIVDGKGGVETTCGDVDWSTRSDPYVWITGDCQLGGNVYGDKDLPVVLIVEGDFSVTGNFEFWGMIYGMDGLTLNSNSRVHGSMIAENPSKLTNGGYHQIWDPDVLNALADDETNSFLAKLKGSWTNR